MYVRKTLFAQIMDFLPWTTFQRIVDRYGGDLRVYTFTCAEHFRVMAFVQLTYRESLRDIEACFSAQAAKLHHMGFREPLKRSTLADANENRDWHIHADFAQVLINLKWKLYAGDRLGVDLGNIVYALDSTTIDLSLSTFPWAPFRSTKAAVKAHTLLDLRGAIPSSSVSSTCTWWAASSSRERNPIWMPAAFIRLPPIGRRASFATRSSLRMGSTRSSITPRTCAVFVSKIQGPGRVWFFGPTRPCCRR